MLKENPQEAAYRKGVIRLLEGKRKNAIQYLDEAIEMNPKDARAYFFRGIAHDLQSHELAYKTKAISDFERAKALSKDEALTQQAIYRSSSANQRVRVINQWIDNARSTPPFSARKGMILGCIVGIISIYVGGWFVVIVSPLAEFLGPLVLGFITLGGGILAITGGFLTYKGNYKRGCTLIIIGGFLSFVTIIGPLTAVMLITERRRPMRAARGAIKEMQKELLYSR